MYIPRKRLVLIMAIILCFLLIITISISMLNKGKPATDVVYQVSTFNALSQGVFEGSKTLDDIKNFGDIGIGTFDRLDGQMIFLDKTFYKVNAGGNVNEVKNDTTPYCIITGFDEDSKVKLKDISNMENLKKELDKYVINKNLIYAFKIDADLKSFKLESYNPQQKPYKPLKDISGTFPTFDGKDLSGNIIGFYIPAYMDKISQPGYVFTFISEDKKIGGNLIEANISSCTARIDECGEFKLVLPQNESFKNANLDTK